MLPELFRLQNQLTIYTCTTFSPQFKELALGITIEPRAYRRTEISSGDHQIVALEAVEKSEELGLLIHYNKMDRG